MADLFRCDKCHGVGPTSGKAGRLIIQELGVDKQPHPSLFNRRGELCRPCLQALIGTMQAVFPKPTLEEAQAIVSESRMLP